MKVSIANKQKQKQKQQSASLALTLDSHWESLSPQEKKAILRIEKEQVLQIIRNYQNDTSSTSSSNTSGGSGHSCNCSVCGRRHMAMDQEMERIYNVLYSLDKIKDPELNPVKFHLGIIKELQISKNSNNSNNPPTIKESQSHDTEHTDFDDDNQVMKTFLSSNPAQSPTNDKDLKEEVLHFKQLKQKQAMSQGHLATPAAAPVLKQEIDEQQLREKYLNFTKTFISSHPKIAKEYVSKMMSYPEMRSLTNDLMSHASSTAITNPRNFITALENFVMPPDSNNKDTDTNNPREFTTMLHNGKPLTAKEYSDLQRNIAERMTSSYDTKKKEFNEVSPLEKELFTRFMFGDDRAHFGELVMKSFKEKFNHEFGGNSVSASLAAAAAAAAAATSNPEHNEVEHETDLYEDESNHEVLSEYDYEDDEEEDDEEDDLASEDDALEMDHESFQQIHDIYEQKKIRNEIIGDHHGALTSNVHDEKKYPHDHSGEAIDMHHQHQHYANEHAYHEDVDEDLDVDEDEEDEDYDDDEDEDNDEEDEDEEYDSGIDEGERLEEGKKLIQIAITKLLQGRIMASYHEKQADVNRLKLLKELEDEKLRQKEREEKKQKKKEKEKEKKRQQQLAKEEEKKRKELEQERLRKESEQRELERREAQRKKVEEAKRKKDEEKKRKLEEQRRREEQQEQQRKVKEDLRRKREEEKKQKEEELKKLKDEKRQEQKRLQEEKRLREEKKLKEQQLQNKKAAESQKKTAKKTVKSLESKQLKTRTSQNPSPKESLPELPFSTAKKSVDDDIFAMINAATALNPSRSPSNLARFVQPNSSISHDISPMNQVQGSNQFVPQDENVQGYVQSTNSMTLPNGSYMHSTSENSALDDRFSLGSLTSALPGMPTHQLPGPPGIVPNAPFGMPSWNNFPNMQDSAVQQSFPSNNQPAVPSLGLPNNHTNQRKSLADELQSLTTMLSSAGLDDSNFSPPATFQQNSLWNDQHPTLRSNQIGSNTKASVGSMGLENGNPSSINMGTPSLTSATPLPTHRSSIWDTHDGNNTSNSGTLAMDHSHLLSSIPSLPNSSDSANYLSSNIWNNNSVPYDNNNNNMSLPRGAVYPVSTNANGPNMLETIYKNYVNIAAKDLTTQYLSVDTLYQSLLGVGLDYPSFINCLLNMRNSYGCEVLTTPAGLISHVKMIGPEQATRPETSLLNGILDNVNDSMSFQNTSSMLSLPTRTPHPEANAIPYLSLIHI